MAVPELTRAVAVREVAAFLDGRVPAHAAHRVRLEFSVRGNAITLVERRAPWRPELGPEWSSLKVAQLRYDAGVGAWSLYWRDRNERWHPYRFATASRDVGPLLDEIDRDPTGIFWG